MCVADCINKLTKNGSVRILFSCYFALIVRHLCVILQQFGPSFVYSLH